MAAAGALLRLDVGELLQRVRGQQRPDDVEQGVYRYLRGDSVHVWCPFH